MSQRWKYPFTQVSLLLSLQLTKGSLFITTILKSGENIIEEMVYVYFYRANFKDIKT